MNLYDDFGGDRKVSWKAIAQAMGQVNPRTPAMVRNRYLRIMKGRTLAANGLARNKCGKCGQIKRGHVCTADPAVVSTNIAVQEQQHALLRQQQQVASAAVTCPPGTSAFETPEALGPCFDEAAASIPLATAVVPHIGSLTPLASKSDVGACSNPPTNLSSSSMLACLRGEQSLFAPIAEPADFSPSAHQSLDVSPVSVSPVLLSEMLAATTEPGHPPLTPKSAFAMMASEPSAAMMAAAANAAASAILADDAGASIALSGEH